MLKKVKVQHCSWSSNVGWIRPWWKVARCNFAERKHGGSLSSCETGFRLWTKAYFKRSGLSTWRRNSSAKIRTKLSLFSYFLNKNKSPRKGQDRCSISIWRSVGRFPVPWVLKPQCCSVRSKRKPRAKSIFRCGWNKWENVAFSLLKIYSGLWRFRWNSRMGSYIQGNLINLFERQLNCRVVPTRVRRSFTRFVDTNRTSVKLPFSQTRRSWSRYRTRADSKSTISTARTGSEMTHLEVSLDKEQH